MPVRSHLLRLERLVDDPGMLQASGAHVLVVVRKLCHDTSNGISDRDVALAKLAQPLLCLRFGHRGQGAAKGVGNVAASQDHGRLAKARLRSRYRSRRASLAPLLPRQVLAGADLTCGHGPTKAPAQTRVGIRLRSRFLLFDRSADLTCGLGWLLRLRSLNHGWPWWTGKICQRALNRLSWRRWAGGRAFQITRQLADQLFWSEVAVLVRGGTVHPTERGDSCVGSRQPAAVGASGVTGVTGAAGAAGAGAIGAAAAGLRSAIAAAGGAAAARRSVSRFQAALQALRRSIPSERCVPQPLYDSESESASESAASSP